MEKTRTKAAAIRRGTGKSVQEALAADLRRIKPKTPPTITKGARNEESASLPPAERLMREEWGMVVEDDIDTPYLVVDHQQTSARCELPRCGDLHQVVKNRVVAMFSKAEHADLFVVASELLRVTVEHQRQVCASACGRKPPLDHAPQCEELQKLIKRAGGDRSDIDAVRAAAFVEAMRGLKAHMENA